MIDWFFATLKQYPEIAIFLTLGIGYYFGKFTFKGIGLGSVTATLLAGVVIGQIGITIAQPLKSTVFLMFLFAVGYAVGPQFVRGVARDGVPNFPVAMKLCLFRIDPSTLSVSAYAILDNAESANVTDGYYPVPYFREKDGRTYLRVVDYKSTNRQPPQIMEFEYLWDEVR